MHHLRTILAPIAGILVALCLIGLLETIGHRVYPPPPKLDFSNPDVVRAYIATLPAGALLFVLAGWVSGTFGGILVAALIGRAHVGRLAGVIGGIVLAATIANFVFIPHPAWFMSTALIAIAAAAYGAWKLAARLTARTENLRPET